MNQAAAFRLHGHVEPGAPGIDHLEPEPPPQGTVKIRVIDFCPERIEERCFEDLDAVLTEQQPEWAAVRWIDLDDLHPYVVERFLERFGFHTLAAEDVLHVPQRPRVEAYEDHLFITTRMVAHDPTGNLIAEQVSMFLFDDLLITFQQWEGDVFDPIRARLRQVGSRLRHADAGFLAYSLLDAIVDACFPLMERYSDLLEDLEDEALEAASPEVLQRIQHVKREMALLRRVMWPTRELVDQLMQEEERLSPSTRTYLRDVLIHVMQLIDMLEAHKETAAELVNLYMSVVSNRMNEVMKVLTIIATVFIPITFLAGVYGMNFRHFPELDWAWSYPAFWTVCATMTAVLLYYFRKKSWL
jgi:magnesium transporter